MQLSAPPSQVGSKSSSVITEHQLYTSPRAGHWVLGEAPEGSSGVVLTALLVHRWCLLAPAGPRGHLQPGAEDRREPGGVLCFQQH